MDSSGGKGGNPFLNGVFIGGIVRNVLASNTDSVTGTTKNPCVWIVPKGILESCQGSGDTDHIGTEKQQVVICLKERDDLPEHLPKRISSLHINVREGDIRADISFRLQAGAVIHQNDMDVFGFSKQTKPFDTHRHEGFTSGYDRDQDVQGIHIEVPFRGWIRSGGFLPAQ
ncbi:MAG: hypothetical protein IKS07_05595 [Lachnospiraceae bacterium]|nr:hypothetical protein [Lachnospiraceae bacterium]